MREKMHIYTYRLHKRLIDGCMNTIKMSLRLVNSALSNTLTLPCVGFLLVDKSFGVAAINISLSFL